MQLNLAYFPSRLLHLRPACPHLPRMRVSRHPSPSLHRTLTRRAFVAAGAAVLALPAVAADTGTPRILAFGDSLFEGYGLPPDQGLLPELAEWLERHHTPATLLNAGLSGDTTYGGRVRIHWSMRRPADAVMIELGGNDLLLGWSAEQAEANLDAILQRATRGGRPVLLIGIQPPIGSADQRDQWRRIWPRLAERHGTLLLPDLYAPFAALPRDRVAAMLQADGVHPSAAGAALIAAHLGPAVQRLIAAVRA